MCRNSKESRLKASSPAKRQSKKVEKTESPKIVEPPKKEETLKKEDAPVEKKDGVKLCPSPEKSKESKEPKEPKERLLSSPKQSPEQPSEAVVPRKKSVEPTQDSSRRHSLMPRPGEPLLEEHTAIGTRKQIEPTQESSKHKSDKIMRTARRREFRVEMMESQNEDETLIGVKSIENSE